MLSLRLLTTCVFAVILASPAKAQLTVPPYNSRPGAAYTIYLDYSGFAFTGAWGGTISPDGTPGFTPAYDIDGNPSAFSPQELANIHNNWSRVAEKFSPFSINVTTVDPAPPGSTDAQRQAFYDSTAQFMHTVVGGDGAWFQPPNPTGHIGASFTGVAQNSYDPSGQNGGAGAGFHTNWLFSALGPDNMPAGGEVAAHENGHGLSLTHQSDFNGNTLVNEYSAGTGTGPGSKAPIMGNSVFAERGVWRIGTARSAITQLPYIQNDVAVILSNANIGNLIDDGMGHSRATATTLPLNGNAIDFNVAKGVIVPISSTNPQAVGQANYQEDFFSFSTVGGTNTINLIAGRSTITPGVADPGAMLDGSLQLLDANGNVIATSATSSLDETISQDLAAGTYYIRVYSAGGSTVDVGFGPQDYYDMGSYFLTGNLALSVPEPTTAAFILSATCVAFYAWRRKRKKATAIADAELTSDS